MKIAQARSLKIRLRLSPPITSTSKTITLPFCQIRSISLRRGPVAGPAVKLPPIRRIYLPARPGGTHRGRGRNSPRRSVPSARCRLVLKRKIPTGESLEQLPYDRGLARTARSGEYH